jgi:hypothetical protein
MSWRKKKHNGPGVKPPDSKSAVPNVVPEIPPALRSLVQEAADLARRELNDTGKITARELFVHEDQPLASGTKSVLVTLTNRSELQRDTVRKRIRDKALHEGAWAVVVTYDEKPGTLTVLGMAAEARITVLVTYSFDTKTKTVSRWESQWGTESVSH